ncbi:MAG: MaoC/PaaZ C-terminal domain-containing protein [Gammaproteobacteria bacterium]|nr:MaoC/PaaZ C-terminal domain-containing protein [Gammaproteobacteria bacterium]MDE0224499.1 MaoC/PaaZ C-terminal domain-containing protein [Gammaproteobacteria bacterium]
MRYYEDIPLDHRWIVGTHPLSEAAIIEFAQAWDPQPFHTDAEAARASVFGGLVASSAHLFAICTRLFFNHPDPIRVVAMLGKDKLRLPNPARAGTTLTYETRCIEKRDSSSRADVGIVTLADTVTDDAGTVVLTQEVSLMVARRQGL